MKISKTIILPQREAEDLEELKEIVRQLVQAVEELHRTIYGDLMETEERLTALEP